MPSPWPNYFWDKVRAWTVVIQTSLKEFRISALVEEESDSLSAGFGQLAMWHKVDSELTDSECIHHRFWWRQHTGKNLAILLYNAGYSPDLQYRDLKFFSNIVAPYLGISHQSSTEDKPLWPSFMTDDGGPLELSWDWGTTGKTPTIRYSIEPIGLDAGTSLDPGNLKAGPAFQRHLTGALPNMNLEWFHHFETFFTAPIKDALGLVQDSDDHNSSIFYAFDLSGPSITAKTYFFPKLRAKAHGVSNLDVLAQAIYSAPHATEHNLDAWNLFLDFCSAECELNLEHEMLSIDHVEPLKSRLKIYFRSRDTSFDSVVKMVTLGGRIKSANLCNGINDLSRLWNLLFERDVGPDQPLGKVGHRTAGLLYNMEFKLGDMFPVAKVYLAVRHYSGSDEAIINGLSRYFAQQNRDSSVPQYTNAIRTMLQASPGQPEDPENLMGKSYGVGPRSVQTKVHTYIGCTIRPDGALRVVSYLKPLESV